MAKKGMKRPDETHTQPPNQMVFDSKPVELQYHENKDEKPISDAYPAIDNDLARDNLENDIPDADLQDL